MDQLVTALAAATDGIAPPPAKKRARGKKGEAIPREKRLEQNRKAAIESRRRKKVMVSSAWLCHRWRRVDFLPFTLSTVPCVAMCHLLLVELCLFQPLPHDLVSCSPFIFSSHFLPLNRLTN